MPILQLELNLWQQLAEANQSPQAVNWQQLLQPSIHCYQLGKDYSSVTRDAIAAQSPNRIAEFLSPITPKIDFIPCSA